MHALLVERDEGTADVSNPRKRDSATHPPQQSARGIDGGAYNSNLSSKLPLRSEGTVYSQAITLHVEAASAAAVAAPTAWTFERTAAERASFYGRQTHMASAPLCPECPQHPPLVKEATEFLCHSCGYI